MEEESNQCEIGMKISKLDRKDVVCIIEKSGGKFYFSFLLPDKKISRNGVVVNSSDKSKITFAVPNRVYSKFEAAIASADLKCDGKSIISDNITIISGAGDVDMRLNGKNIYVETNSGDMDLMIDDQDGIPEKISCTAHSGDISGKYCGKEVLFSTKSGDVDARVYGACDTTLKAYTMSGDATIELQDFFKNCIQYKAKVGDAENTFEVNSNAENMIKGTVETICGDISIC